MNNIYNTQILENIVNSFALLATIIWHDYAK